MGAAEDVALQFINQGDPNELYAGRPAGSTKVIDIRGMIKFITWDLLRFQRPTDLPGSNSDSASGSWGMRDSVSRQHLVAEQNNFMLRKLCAANNIDLTDLPGS